jgi:FkbM family methyltransferase
MTFVSYAQNFEDVMLWRALKHIEKGFYVDVGAQHPVIDSVSQAFYERGWRGVHIEPVPQYAELLRKDRADETVLQVALADAEGTLELNVIPDTGLSTAVNAYAQRHLANRGFAHQRIQVPVLTLTSALRLWAGKDIHWLKIDVEGLEEQVIKGWDSQILRPWIILVEATTPDLPAGDYAGWEPILTAADYQFVYFDGLNRFYVSKEHSELAESFSCPPNYFDDVVVTANSSLCREVIKLHHAREADLIAGTEKLAAGLKAANEHSRGLQARTEWLQNEWDAAKQRVEQLNQHAGRLEGELESERERSVQLGADLQAARADANQLQARAEWLKNEWDAAKAKIDELNQSAHQWWTVADQLNRELQSFYASKSWRITAPLRQGMRVTREMMRLPTAILRSVLQLTKRVGKSVVSWSGRQVMARPELKMKALVLLARHPRLKERLRPLAARAGVVPSLRPDPLLLNTIQRDLKSLNVDGEKRLSPMPDEVPDNLSARAARVYADLRRAIELSKR